MQKSLKLKQNEWCWQQQKQSYSFKNFDYLFGATFIKPGVFTPDTDLRSELKIQQDVLENYTTKAIKGN